MAELKQDFYRLDNPSCDPINSVKALKGKSYMQLLVTYIL